MKKRALSMLLALALCFTMFAGIGSAAAVNVDRALTAVGNILDNVAQDAEAPADQVKRIDVIKAAAANDATTADISAEPWAALATALLKDEAIDDTAAENPTIYPYFLLRYIADPENAIDLTDKENIQAAIEEMDKLDAEINTANEGVNASVSKFGPYQDRLTEIVTDIFERDTYDAVQEFVGLGFLSEEGEYTNKDVVVSYAKKQIFKVAQYISDMVFATTSEELNAAYGALMGDDITKKNAALVAGQELLEKVTSSNAEMTEYFKANKDFFKSEIIDAYLSASFSADSAVAVAAVQEAAAKVAEKLEADAENNSTVGEIAALLAGNLRLTFTEISGALTKTINALDTDDKDFQAVWFDLGVNRALGIYNLGLSAKLSTIANGQSFTLGVYREALKTRLGIENAIEVTDKVLVVSGTEGVSVAYDKDMNAWTLSYNDEKLPASSAKLHVYRGATEEGADETRYISTFTVNLKAKEVEPASIELDETVLQKEYHRGDSVIIKGTSTGFDGITVTIVKPDGTAYVFETITPEQFANEGVVYGIAEDAELNKDFTIIVGGANGEANTDTYTFRVVAEEAEKSITVEDLSGWQYKVGDTVVIKGTATGLENITVTVTDPDGNVVDHVVITAEQYAEGYELKIGENFAYGKYTVVVGENDVTAETYFLVGAENKGVKLDPVNAEYLPGSAVLIKGTSAGFDALVITIIKPNGEAYYYATITPEELEAGFEIGIAEDANIGDIYTIIVGESGEFNDSVSFKITDSTEVVELVKEGKIASSVYVKRGTAWEDVLAKLPKTITLTNEDGTVSVEVEIIWNSEDYDPTSTKTQTITGTYTVPAGYVAGSNVDGKVSINVTRSTGGSSISTDNNTTKTITLDKTVLKSDYSAGESVVIKGTSTGYTTITITVTAPDGTTKTVEISADEFKNGYNLSLAKLGFTQSGEYAIDVEGQKFTVNYKGVTDEIFNKEDHMAYVIGYEDGTVRPEANISREEVTTILYRLLKDDVRTAFQTETTDAFNDVESDRWSMTYIATLNKLGILKGYEDGSFQPGKAITRAEFAALCSRLASVEPASIVESEYSDVSGHWAENDIYVVTAEGWFLGDAEGTFRPNDNITRAEAITVINRILDRDQVTTESFQGFEIVQFSDLSADAWYYAEVVEATNAHGYDKDATTGDETWKKIAELVVDDAE